MCIRDRYVLVPFLLRVLQLADQLSVSAVARGAERPGVRGSYYEKDVYKRQGEFQCSFWYATDKVNTQPQILQKGA